MKIDIDKIKNVFKNRFLLFISFLLLFFVGHLYFAKKLIPTTDTYNLWFYSGIIMVLFSILFIEPYYTSPKNVITNTIPLLLVFLAIESSFDNKLYWLIIFCPLLVLLILSVVAIVLCDKETGSNNLKNKISDTLKNISVFFGRGKIIYSIVFIYFLILNITLDNVSTYIKISNGYFFYLMVLWGVILSINPNDLHNTFSFKKKKINKDALGEIFGVQSKKIFLVRLFPSSDRKSVKRFDIVKFKYSMQDSSDYVITGIIFDTYLLNQEKWIKVLELKTVEKAAVLDNNIVYKITKREELDYARINLNIDNFVGIVIQGSTIRNIKFEYSKLQNDLQEGDLLELKIDNKRLFYQVINGMTVKENLEAKNETGFIEGTATQLGEWDNESLSFQKFGWLPNINTPIFKANCDNIVCREFEYPDYKIGVIPNTKIPSVANLHDALSHHLALLGVTGSGKSFLAREIIKELNKDSKIICVDFTGEWKKEISNLEGQAYLLLDRNNINDFLERPVEDTVIGIVELPTISNTSDVLSSTERLFDIIFNFAKDKYENDDPIKISLILEEAHTITPETTFLGDLGDYGSSKALVNKMGQVALQGRKYGVGLMVIAQRTANVSKTVLTQCNTIICFQAFDETSFNFLGNYVGKDMIKVLPNLKQYHAIATGKALKSNLPMIIDLTR